MEHIDKGKESSNSENEVEATNSPIICGLPDDIFLMCLARIPRKYHSVLKRSGLCRNKSNEIFYYVLDPTSSMRYWKLVDDLPPHILKREGMGFEALGNKLFLLGGCSEFLDSTDEVYSYDASSNCCAQATSLSTARYNFACEVLDEKLYAIGGGGSNSSYHSWETFDPLTNYSVILDGKIYVRCSRYPVTPHVFAVVYEPSSGTWEYADEDIVSGWTGPAVAVDGTLYVLDQMRLLMLSLGTSLMMWHKDQVGKLSPWLTRPSQVMMGSSIPGLLSYFNVISCKCLSI
ncbi:hypothetical protein AAZX31_03G009700 [Glycine max]